MVYEQEFARLRYQCICVCLCMSLVMHFVVSGVVTQA